MKTSLFCPLQTRISEAMLEAEGGWGKYPKQGTHARKEIRAREYDKAAESFDKVLNLNPGSADAYYYMGEMYEAKGEMQKAKAQWRKAYNLNPDHHKSKLKLFS